jgi:streptomycin 6-kinase
MPLSNPETLPVPNGLRETIERVHGQRGREWLARLPALIQESRERWSLALDLPFDNLSYNLVIPGRTEQGADVVLKLGVPCRELLTEVAALNLFGGVGAVRLLDHEAERGILLLERARPGAPVYKLQGEAEATVTAARLMRRLWRDPPATGHSFPSLAVWFQAFKRLRDRFNGESGPFPAELIEKGERTFSELSESQERTVILHGDLHHDNILSSERDGWLAIDPKGISGDPGYEVGSFMLNQLPAGADAPALKMVLKRRLLIFSDELQIKRARLARWAFCHALLSALWDFEEAAEWYGTIRLAQMLDELCSEELTNY